MQDATLSPRCLAIMARLTSPELLARLWPVVLRIVRLMWWFRRSEVTPAGTFEFECRLRDLLGEVGRLIVEWSFNQLEPDDRLEMPGQFLWQGDYYRRRRKSPLRNVACLFGPIRLSRFIYQPFETAGRCLFPLQIQLGIVSGVATPALADHVARLSADLTQRHVLDQLRPLGIRWGVGTLRKLQGRWPKRSANSGTPPRSPRCWRGCNTRSRPVARGGSCCRWAEMASCCRL